MTLLKYLTVPVTALFLSGCFGGGPSPDQTSSNQIPEWFVNTPKDNPMYFYGSGEGQTKDEAQSNALSQIAATISVTVESTMSSLRKQSTSNGHVDYSSETEQQVKSSVKAMKFSNYRVTKSAMFGGKYYLLVELDRDGFFATKLKELQALDNAIASEWKRYNTLSVFEKARQVVGIKGKISEALAMLPILSAINEGFKDSQYRSVYEKQMDEMSYVTDNLLATFGTTNSPSVQELVKKYLSQMGIKMVKSKSGLSGKQLDNLIIIDIDVSAKEQALKSASKALEGAHFAKVSVTLTTKAANGKVMAKNIVSVRNISKESFADAVAKTEKLEELIQREGIMNILAGNAQ